MSAINALDSANFWHGIYLLVLLWCFVSALVTIGNSATPPQDTIKSEVSPRTIRTIKKQCPNIPTATIRAVQRAYNDTKRERIAYCLGTLSYFDADTLYHKSLLPIKLDINPNSDFVTVREARIALSSELDYLDN